METLYLSPGRRLTIEDSSRRKILKVIGAAAVAAPLAACATGTTPATVLPAVIAFIQAAMLKSCAIIPSAISIATLIADAFPAAAGVATIGEALAQEIVAAMCPPTTPPPASGKLEMRMKTGTMVLHGFHVVDGALVEF